MALTTLMWAVVTIPSREALAGELIRQLGEPALKVLDTAGDVQCNHIRAWSEVCASGGAGNAGNVGRDWVSVMQDDVVLCDGFAHKARRRLAEAGALGYRAVSFYNHAHLGDSVVRLGERWGRVDLARAPGIRRAEAGELALPSALPGEQCVAVRREVAERYAGFAERHRDLYRMFPGVHDALFGLFLSAEIGGVRDPWTVTESQVYITLPNLVDHRDVASSLSHSHPTHNHRRASATFRPDGD